jgi:DNA-directed RNA polymerase specialized sigma subunit
MFAPMNLANPAPAGDEAPHDTAYKAWKSDPTPDNLRAVVDALDPVVKWSVHQSGGDADALVHQQAKVFAAEAVRKYEPERGAGLPTWTSRQLMQLRRFRRQSAQPVKVPDRVMLDAWHLHKIEQDFIDKHDREPDLVELSDLASMPVKRITAVRAGMRPVVSEGTGEAAGMTGTTEADHTDEALEYVYRDADYIDRKIIEMKLGYGGKHKPMTAAQVAARLKIDPAQVSRRSARLAYQIHEMQQDLHTFT